MSYNLKGLTTLEDRLKTRAFLFGLEVPFDILCGHEHKIHSPNINWLPPIWPATEFIIAPTCDGVHDQRNNNVLIRKDGLFLVIGPKLKAYVSSLGVLPSGQAIWAHLDHP